MDEDKTSQNDEALEDNYSSNEDSQTEGNGETSGESSESDTVTLTKAELDERISAAKTVTRKEQDKRWKDRIKGLKSEEGGEEGGEKSHKKEEIEDEKYERLNLKTEGIKDKKEQDIIIDYANFKGISVDQAISSPAVKAELKELRAKQSTPAPSTRTSTGQRDEVSYWAAQMKKGNRPPTAELRRKAREYLAQK